MMSPAAHPRSRGEHREACRAHDVPGGSSPLARGTPLRTLHGERLPRLIPARAGNTPERSMSGRVSSAHPRSRGEHRSSCRWSLSVSGSSPLARGTLAAAEVFAPLPRLIPARAGNTSCVLESVCLQAAHPRSRGEHKPPRHVARPEGGSSPLARGTLLNIQTGSDPRRLIPARAGNTANSP